MRLSTLRRSRIVRFLIVGGIGTGFSYGVYAVLLFAGMNYAAANFAALVAGILFSFKIQGTLVFENADNRLLGRFVVCWLMIYVVNVAFITRMIDLGINRYVAGALAIPGIAALSYVTQRFVVFRKSGRQGIAGATERP